MGEELRNKQKTRKKLLVWPKSIKLEADCFPVSERTRNKPDPPQVGWESQSSGAKEIKGRVQYGSIEAGNMILIHMNVQDLQ